MNITRKLPQKSREYLGISQNTKRLGDSAPTSPIEVGISKILANFGKKSQDKPNFVARVSLATAQKSTHQKTTASNDRRGFTFCN